MFKILDVLYLGMNLPTLKKEVENQEEYTKFYKKVKRTSGPAKCVWICFPGWNMPIKRAESLGFLPEEGYQLIYQGPMSVVGLSPEQTEESLLRLKKDIEHTLKVEKLDHLPIKFFGFSAGTLPAFWLANNMNSTKLVAVSPGYRLGKGIFNSLITLEAKKVLKEAGWNQNAYDHRVAPFNQENNISNLPDGEIIIYAGKHDTYVPHEHSVRLFEKIHMAGKSPTFVSFDMLDHVSIILYLALLNKRGKDPYKLEKDGQTEVAA